MKLEAILSWNPHQEFEKANPIEIRLSIGDSKRFQGFLKRYDTAIDYINSLSFYASDWENCNTINPSHEEKGKKLYEIPILAKGTVLEELENYAERIQRKYYLVTRNEWVTDEEYCKFYGSSGNLWHLERCAYVEGDFEETIRQTVYDMEHGRPMIYTWTNVPKILALKDRMRNNPMIKEFIEEIKPLVSAFYHSGSRQNHDFKDMIKQLNLIANLAEKYKKQHGLERL